MADKKRLRIQLLGPPLLFWDDKPVLIQRRMARFLLYYLAIYKGLRGRDEIANDFWYRFDNQRQRLRDILSKLRMELPDPDLILIDRDMLGLDHSQCDVDVIEFEDLYRQTTLPFLSVENRPLPEAIFQKMVYADSLWQAPNFLTGMGLLDSEELEEWSHSTNRRLRRMRLDLLMRVSQHLVNNYEFELALQWLNRTIALDEEYMLPSAVFLKIDVLFRMQRWIESYEYATASIQEMGLDWFGGYRLQLKSMIEQMENLHRRQPEIMAVSLPAHSAQHIPLANQEEILQNLGPLSQRGGIICLQGDAGSGKTHILKRFETQFSTKGRWLYLKANFFHQNKPFYALLEGLRQTLHEEDWRRLEPFWGLQIVSLLPEIQQYWEVTQVVDFAPPGFQGSIYEAFHQLFTKLAGEGKLAIALDNAHWADEETLSMLVYCAQRPVFAEKAVVLLTYQPEVDNRVLHQILLHQHEIEPFSLLRLQALSHEDISRVGFNIFGKNLREPLLNRIEKVCGGNVLFVIETMRALIAMYGIQDERVQDRIPLPGAVHAVLRNRLDSLEKNTRLVLECAAVIGDPFTFQNIVSALEIGEVALVAALEELQKKELVFIESTPFVSDKYYFKIGFLREVTTMETSATKKQLFHWRMARSFEKEYEKTHNTLLIAKIAHHFSEAGETSISFDYWIRLAEHQYMREYERSTSEAYQNAQHIANFLKDQLTTKQLYAIYIGWGEQALFQHDLTHADDCFKKAVLFGQKRSDPLLLGAGYSGLGAIYTRLGLYFQAHQYLEQAENFLQNDHWGEYLRVRTRKAELMMSNALLPESIAELEALGQEYPRANTPFEHFVIGESQLMLAFAYVYAGKFSKAEQLASEIRNVLKVYRNLPLQAQLGILMGRISYLKGNYSHAAEQFSLSVQIAEIYSAWNLALLSTTFSSQIALKQGKIFHCLEQIRNSYELSELYQYQGNYAHLFNSHARVYLFLGDFQQAGELFEKGLSYSKQKYDVLLNIKGLALTQYCKGDKEIAYKTLQEVVEMSTLYGFQMLARKAHTQLVLLEYCENADPKAVQQLQALQQLGQHDSYGGEGSALAYVSAYQSMAEQNYSQAKLAADHLLEMGQREDSLWLTWHAFDLQRKIQNARGEDSLKYQVDYEDCIRKIRQMLPKELRPNVKLEKPPLAVLV